MARTLERNGKQPWPNKRASSPNTNALARTPAIAGRVELAAIRELTPDLPALWQAATTMQLERQTIVRSLLERVLVEVDATEKVRLECHWHGGSRTTHKLTLRRAT